MWCTSPQRALANSFHNSHFSVTHRATFGVGDPPQPSRCERVGTADGFDAETTVPAANPGAFRRVIGVADAITARHIRVVDAVGLKARPAAAALCNRSLLPARAERGVKACAAAMDHC